MDEKQTKALQSLSRAFAKCKEAGVCFIGMDDDLLAYDRKSLSIAEKKTKDLYKAQKACGQGVAVKDHGCYIESGGW